MCIGVGRGRVTGFKHEIPQDIELSDEEMLKILRFLITFF